MHLHITLLSGMFFALLYPDVNEYLKGKKMFSTFCCAIVSGTILVIDDEIAILKMLKLKLIRLGFLVDTAESGEEGLKKINSNKYALVLTDIKMPGISGDRILHYVKDEKKSSIPVVGMSGTPWLLDQNDFDAILSKPCSLKETGEVLCRLIKNEK